MQREAAATKKKLSKAPMKEKMEPNTVNILPVQSPRQLTLDLHIPRRKNQLA